MEVSLGPRVIELDGDPLAYPNPPLKKGNSPPIFGPCLLWPNGRPPQLLLSTCYLIIVEGYCSFLV